ncbi:MAG: zinc ribbon domain-containing protein, partial [Candidatus Thorarchaeota archaeon]
GAGVDASDKECPYCGASVVQTTVVHQSDLKRPDKLYTTATDADGNTHIRFGDGQTGRRPSSGSGSVSSTYRQGAGSQGNVPAGHLVEKLDPVQRHLDKIPDPSKHKESKDVGIAMVESMAALGDLLSVYQSSVSHEAHLSTDDRDRVSKKEERIRPKLKSMVVFCEKVDSKTQKKMGLSDSDVHKIRTTATRALQMTEARSGKCAGCGTMNIPGSRNCQNCGAPL